MIIEENYDDGKSQFTMKRDGRLVEVVFTGASTIAGNRAFTGWVDSQIAAAQPLRLVVMLDIRALDSVGLRVKIALARWIVAVRGSLSRVAVVGEDPTARALAGAIKGIQFFDEPAVARTWLVGDQ